LGSTGLGLGVSFLAGLLKIASSSSSSNRPLFVVVAAFFLGLLVCNIYSSLSSKRVLEGWAFGFSAEVGEIDYGISYFGLMIIG